MAGYITRQELLDASVDAGTLDEYVNGENGVPNVNRDGENVGNLQTLNAQALALAAGAANLQTYLTKAAMDADTSQPVNTVAQVTNDPAADNNGYYVWNGTTWVVSGIQPVSSDQLTAIALIANSALDKVNAVPVITGSGDDAFIFIDALGRIALVIKKTAVTEAAALRVIGGTDADNLFEAGELKVAPSGTEMLLGETTFSVQQNADYWMAWVDPENRIAFGIKWTGETVIGFSGSLFSAQQGADLTARVATLENSAASGGGGSARVAPVVGYIDGNQVHTIDADGTDAVTLDFSALATGVADPHARLEGNSLLAVTNRAHFSAQAATAIAVRPQSDGSHLVVDPTQKICYVYPTIGQSNSVGSRGVPADLSVFLSDEFANSLMMLDTPDGNGVRLTYGTQVFDPGSVTRLVPLKSMVRRNASDPEGYGLGITHAEGMGFRLAREFRNAFGFDPFMVCFTAGVGGKLYEELKKGTIPYNNLLAAVQRVKELVEPDGYRVVVPFVTIVHGESDANRKTYQQGILDWQTDLQTDLQAITDQTSAIPCLCSQASTFGKIVPDRQILGAVPGSTASVGRLIWGVYPTYLACKPRTTHHMCGPYYNLQFSDDYLHLNKYGHPVNGEFVALTAMATVFGTKNYGAILPADVVFDGTSVITITFDVPVAPLVRDETISDPGQWGFEIFDGDGWSMTNPDHHPGVTITPELVDGVTIRLTCSAPIPAGPQRSVGYALQGWPAPKQEGQGSRGQIRDSSPDISMVTGERLYRRLPHFLEIF